MVVVAGIVVGIRPRTTQRERRRARHVRNIRLRPGSRIHHRKLTIHSTLHRRASHRFLSNKSLLTRLPKKCIRSAKEREVRRGRRGAVLDISLCADEILDAKDLGAGDE